MIASFLGGVVEGDSQVAVSTLAKIEEGHSGALSFLSNPKYINYIYTTESSIVIVSKDFVAEKPVSATLVRVDDSRAAFAKLLELYAASKPKREGQSSLAFVDSSATLGENCYIGEYAVVGKNVTIGDRVSIHPTATIGNNVTIGDDVTIYAGVHIYDEVIIKDRVMIHAGTVVGSDGFGFTPDANGVFTKVPHIGTVIIESDVEIGANTCIDRATVGETVISQGVKLDNLIQIAHNVTIGKHTVMAAQNGVAGSSKIGAHCMFAGQVGIAGHLTVADKVQLGSKTGIASSVKQEGAVMLGFPALPGKQYHRSSLVFKTLPEMATTLRRLERQVAELEKKLAE